MTAELTLESVHRAEGARFVERMGFRLPADYGDAAREQQHVHAAAGLFDRSYRGVLDLTGKNVVQVMNGVFSSAVARLATDRGQLSTLLTAKGRIIAGFQLFRPEDGLLRLVFLEPLRDAVLKGIHKYAFLSDIGLGDRTAQIGVLSLEGAAATRTLSSAAGGVALPALPLGAAPIEISGVDVTVVRAGESPEGGYELWVPRPQLANVWQALATAARGSGGGPCGHDAAEALRIEAGIGRQGLDYDDENFPNDAGWEPALTYDKCYVGQEIVARMRTYGQANRRLEGVLFPPGTVPHAPAPLVVSKEEAGKVTSSAASARWGRGLGLAMVKRKFWEARAGAVEGMSGPIDVEIAELPLVRLDDVPRS